MDLRGGQVMRDGASLVLVRNLQDHRMCSFVNFMLLNQSNGNRHLVFTCCSEMEAVAWQPVLLAGTKVCVHDLCFSVICSTSRPKVSQKTSPHQLHSDHDDSILVGSWEIPVAAEEVVEDGSDYQAVTESREMSVDERSSTRGALNRAPTETVGESSNLKDTTGVLPGSGSESATLTEPLRHGDQMLLDLRRKTVTLSGMVLSRVFDCVLYLVTKCRWSK